MGHGSQYHYMCFTQCFCFHKYYDFYHLTIKFTLFYSTVRINKINVYLVLFIYI